MSTQRAPTLTPLPCPFCGKLPVIGPTRPMLYGDAWGEVRCRNARCPAQPYVLDGASVADDRGSGAYKDLAIARWNKRAGSATVEQQKLKKLEE